MNLPNRLTLLRMVLVPFLVLFLLVDAIPFSYLWALLVFVAASFTDFLDGKIARSRGLVTNFGKFLDPMADKVLVLSAMICLIPDLCSPVVVIIVAAREFMVHCIGSRLVRQGKDRQPDGIDCGCAFDVLHHPDCRGGAAHRAGEPDLDVDYRSAGSVQRGGIPGKKLETGQSQTMKTERYGRRFHTASDCRKTFFP